LKTRGGFSSPLLASDQSSRYATPLMSDAYHLGTDDSQPIDFAQVLCHSPPSTNFASLMLDVFHFAPLRTQARCEFCTALAPTTFSQKLFFPPLPNVPARSHLPILTLSPNHFSSLCEDAFPLKPKPSCEEFDRLSCRVLRSYSHSLSFFLPKAPLPWPLYFSFSSFINRSFFYSPFSLVQRG